MSAVETAATQQQGAVVWRGAQDDLRRAIDVSRHLGLAAIAGLDQVVMVY
jgi:hypothetical protein